MASGMFLTALAAKDLSQVLSAGQADDLEKHYVRNET